MTTTPAPEYRVDPDNPACTVYRDGATDPGGSPLWADAWSGIYRRDAEVEGWTRLVPADRLDGLQKVADALDAYLKGGCSTAGLARLNAARDALRGLAVPRG